MASTGENSSKSLIAGQFYLARPLVEASHGRIRWTAGHDACGGPQAAADLCVLDDGDATISFTEYEVVETRFAGRFALSRENGALRPHCDIDAHL